MTEQTKYCSKCEKDVPESGWQPSQFKKTGSWCRECQNGHAKQYEKRKYKEDQQKENNQKSKYCCGCKQIVPESGWAPSTFKRKSGGYCRECAKEYNNSPAKYEVCSDKLFADEVFRSPFNPENLATYCKNSECQRLFEPTNRQVQSRINAINGKWSIGSECHFYCCEECKSNCVLFNTYAASHVNPNRELSYTAGEYNTWKAEVRRINKEEYGKTQCEICGSTKRLEAHHIQPVKINPGLALDPDNGIVLCKDCHHQAHGSFNECATGYLANNDPCFVKK